MHLINLFTISKEEADDRIDVLEKYLLDPTRTRPDINHIYDYGIFATEELRDRAVDIQNSEERRAFERARDAWNRCYVLLTLVEKMENRS